MFRTTITALLTAILAGAAGAAAPREVVDEDLDRAIDQTKRYLYTQQGAAGHWSHYAQTVPGGGDTAIACFALLEAGEDHNNEKLKKGLEALSELKTENLYVVAVRVMAFSQVVARAKDSPYRAQLEKDIKWLTDKAASGGGAWGYGGPEKDGDNSCSQFALLALWEADRAGIAVNPNLIRLAEQTWLHRQRKDGGWTYAGQQDVKTDSTLTMTTAGLASLFICQDVLTTACQPYPNQKAVDAALAYLGANLKDDYYRNEYLAFCVQRVGMASGTKFLAKLDWLAVGAAKLAEPNPYGKGFGGQWGPVVRASLELVFLARGRIPLTINKLRHGPESDWNVHTRDVPNFTEFMRRNFERRMRWQVVGIEEDVAQMLDAPILLIAGSEALDFSPEQWAKLRQYALRGGTMLLVPTHGNKEFLESARTALAELFAEQRKLAGAHYDLQPLPAEHPVYNLLEPIPNGPTAAPMWGVSDGTRLLAVLCQRDITCPWQKRAAGAAPRPPDAGATGKLRFSIDYTLGVNLFLYATGGNNLRMRLRPVFAGAAGEVKTKAAVAWLRHDGNWCSQPYALQSFAEKLLVENRVGIDVTVGVPIDEASLAGHHLAWMTGSSAFSLSEAQLAALRGYLDRGGTLFVNAVGGAREFNDSAAVMLEKLFAGRDVKAVGVPPDSPLVTGKSGDFRGPPLAAVSRTRAWVRSNPQVQLPLKVYNQLGRSVAIYCPYGLHDTLDGHTAHAAESYMPTTARDIAVNIVLYALLNAPPRAASAPAGGPATTTRPATASAPAQPGPSAE